MLALEKSLVLQATAVLSGGESQEGQASAVCCFTPLWRGCACPPHRHRRQPVPGSRRAGWRQGVKCADLRVRAAAFISGGCFLLLFIFISLSLSVTNRLIQISLPLCLPGPGAQEHPGAAAAAKAGSERSMFRPWGETWSKGQVILSPCSQK